MSTLYGVNVPANAPAKRTIDLRSLQYGVSGPEQPYPVYQFSGYRVKWEYPGHNPFADETTNDNLGPQPAR